MPSFARSFAVNELARWDAAHPSNAVRDLFYRWALPGFHATRSYMLRVGIRDGYLNLYVKGQSVAKLSVGRKGPSVEVHEAYVAGRRRTDENETGSPPGQSYVCFDAEALAKPETAALVSGWIATAESYAGAEKRFVDELIGWNGGVIDLEMGLPAGETAAGEVRTAPRMDLVVAQAEHGEPTQIAFWEAKCSINPELRANADYSELDGKYVAGPKVIHQLRKYQHWMGADDRMAQVRQAYRETATILLGLATLFDKTAFDTQRVWEALAATQAPEVILPPGVVIANFCPKGHEPTGEDGAALFRARAKSFGPHRQKIERHGIAVHEAEHFFEPDDFVLDPRTPSHQLPHLHAGTVTA